MTTLMELQGTRWSGKAELWLDPMGNDAKHSDCTIAIHEGSIRYTWNYEGQPHEGTLALRDDGADFTDSWHQPTPMRCDAIADHWALLAVKSTYGAGEGPDWGWRTSVALRPTGELILQMTNVAPWGEHGRAVRMIATRDGS